MSSLADTETDTDADPDPEGFGASSRFAGQPTATPSRRDPIT
jgi:hypothetical protein